MQQTQTLLPLGPAFELADYRLGQPQQSGALTVVPVFGPARASATRYTSPLSGLKLSQVRGYGNLELSNPAQEGIAIVPLHTGYIQDQAQNHALCQSGFIAAGQKRMFEDACCVQAAQGGYLAERDQWFFILPLQLREKALSLRGEKNYSKLWAAIADLNRQFKFDGRGHLEQILSRERAYLTQYQSRFELLEGQSGALFFLRGKLAGIEIAPSPAYFAELWMALVCFSYGVAAMYEERVAAKDSLNPLPTPFEATSLADLRSQFLAERSRRENEIAGWLGALPPQTFESQEEERFLDLRLNTLQSEHFAGQVVTSESEEERDPLYVSLFARPAYLYAS